MVEGDGVEGLEPVKLVVGVGVTLEVGQETPVLRVAFAGEGDPRVRVGFGCRAVRVGSLA